MAFIITPGLDFKLTATGDKYMTFYVVSEKIPDGFTPRSTLRSPTIAARRRTTNAWFDKERPLITKDEWPEPIWRRDPGRIEPHGDVAAL